MFFLNRMVKSVHHNSSKFNNIDMNKFQRFEKQLIELEGQLLDGNIYQVSFNLSLQHLLFMFVFIFKQHCVEQIFDEKTNYVSKNIVFMDEFTHYIKQTFESLDPLLSKNSFRRK